MGKKLDVAFVKLDAKSRIRKVFDDDTFDIDPFLLDWLTWSLRFASESGHAAPLWHDHASREIESQEIGARLSRFV